jgi:hypothetical protein
MVDDLSLLYPARDLTFDAPFWIASRPERRGDHPRHRPWDKESRGSRGLGAHVMQKGSELL